MGIIENKSVSLLTLFTLFFILSSLPAAFAETDRLSSRDELHALYHLRSSLGLRARDWPRGEDPCEAWTGVSCDSGRVTGLDVAGFKRTRLGRMMPQFDVEGLKELRQLTRFNASGFFLPGSIPDWFGSQLNPGFSVLDLSGAGVTGQIPESLGNLSKLTVLDLSLNRLKGPIPVSLGNLCLVQTLNLSHNGLSGSIPDELWSLKNLTKLDLSGNGLIGELPPSLSPSIGSTSTIVILSNNLYYGKVPLDFTNSFSHLASVDLSGNYFDGGAPIGSQSRGGSISVSQNCFLEASDQRSPSECLSFYSARGATYEGPSINPSEHPSSKKHRTEIYIMIAAIAGTIILLIIATLLAVLYCVCCRSGRRRPANPILPRHQSQANRTNQNSSSRRSNPAQEPSVSPSIERQASIRGSHLSIGDSARLSAPQSPVPVVPVVGKPDLSQVQPVERFSHFARVGASYTYGHLRRATSDFSDENLIHRGHSGNLYRGVLDDGNIVACKRMDKNLVNKDEYVEVELGLFSKGIHKRFVMLLGKCLDAPKGVRVLVYKFVENGDLGKVLHGKKKKREEEEIVRSRSEEEEENVVQSIGSEEDGEGSIDWIKRLKIASGVAEALCCLHHECLPPRVHRDLKAGSILIDENFEVRLCSLSDMTEEAEGECVPRVQMTASSSSEPSSSPRATCADDVYDMGIILLELISGQSPPATPSAWIERLIPSIDVYKRDVINKIIDPLLFIEEDHHEEVWAVAVLAKACVNPKPDKRPTMKHVRKALENPLKVVRESFRNGNKLRATSSRGSWNASFWGSSRRSEGEEAVM